MKRTLTIIIEKINRTKMLLILHQQEYPFFDPLRHFAPYLLTLISYLENIKKWQDQAADQAD